MYRSSAAPRTRRCCSRASCASAATSHSRRPCTGSPGSPRSPSGSRISGASSPGARRTSSSSTPRRSRRARRSSSATSRAVRAAMSATPSASTPSSWAARCWSSAGTPRRRAPVGSSEASAIARAARRSRAKSGRASAIARAARRSRAESRRASAIARSEAEAREEGGTMANNGFRVMDSDMHVVEPADLWQRYLDPAWRDCAPIGTTTNPRDIGVLVRGEVPNRPGTKTESWVRALEGHMAPLDRDYAFAVERGWDAASQLEAMDREGIDVAVLFPSRGLFVLGFDSAQSVGKDGLEPELAAALARAYNDWLHDFCAADRERLLAAAMVAPHDVDSAVAETRRSVLERGMKAIFLLPGWVNGRPWHDAAYDCARLYGLPV